MAMANMDLLGVLLVQLQLVLEFVNMIQMDRLQSLIHSHKLGYDLELHNELQFHMFLDMGLYIFD